MHTYLMILRFEREREKKNVEIVKNIEVNGYISTKTAAEQFFSYYFTTSLTKICTHTHTYIKKKNRRDFNNIEDNGYISAKTAAEQKLFLTY